MRGTLVHKMKVDEMEEGICYIIDCSYNCYCDFELICNINGSIYFIALDKNWEPVHIEDVVVVTIEAFKKCYSEHYQELASFQFDGLNTLYDLYELTKFPYLYEIEHGYLANIITVNKFFSILQPYQRLYRSKATLVGMK